MSTPAEVDHRNGWRARRWSAVAVIWSAVYLLAAVAWLFGAPNYPYGRHWDPSPVPVSLMDGVPAGIGQLILVIGTAVLLMASLWLMITGKPGALARTATVILFVGCLGLVLVGDYRPLMAVARTPVFVVSHLVWGVGGESLGIGEFVRVMYGIPALHGFWQLAGIAVLLLALRDFWTRMSDGCSDCGRADPMPGWTTRTNAKRWGLLAAVVAVICPVPYAISRYLLMLGIPADGFTVEEIRQLDAETPGIWIFGAGLATFGLLGAVLTLGLVQRWGERWPFWVPVLRGRQIHPLVAIIPAGFVSLLWPGSSLMLIRATVQKQLADRISGEPWLLDVIMHPMNLWIFWGFSLAAATLAYWLRRRPDCATCNRGVEEMRGVYRPGQRPVDRHPTSS